MKLVRISDGSVMEYPATALRVFKVSDILAQLSQSTNTKYFNETLLLEPGLYRMMVYYPCSQISAYDMSFKGRCHVNMIAKSSSGTDLLSAYKLGSFYTHDTDSDLKWDPNELRPKEFIVTQETALSCGLSITTGGKYTWDKMEGSTATIYKYPNTVQEDGTIPSDIPVPYKQWTLSDFELTDNETERKKNEVIIIQPGRYRIEVKLAIPNIHPSDPASYGNKVYIHLGVSKYSGTVSGEIYADAVGVRISQVSTNNEGKSFTIKYKYLDTGNPTGIMMNPLKFSRKKMLIQGGSAVTGGVTAPTLTNYWILSSNNLKPAAGNDVGYSYVEVINPETGTESFSYWNKKNFTAEYNKPLVDPRNGSLLEHSAYSITNLLLKKITNTYSILNVESYHVNARIEDIYSGTDNVMSGNVNLSARACPWGRAIVEIYPSVKYWVEKTKSVEEVSFPQGKVTHENTYTYNSSNLLLSKTEEKTDNNETKIQYLVYPVDYNTTAYPATLVSGNIINFPLEVVNTIKKSSGEFILSGMINQLGTNGKVSSSSNLEFTGDLAVSNFKFSNKTVNGNTTGNLGTYSPYSKYVSRTTATYTTKGNIQHIIKDNNENVVYLWGYNSQYPVAEIVNSTYAKVRDALGGQTVIDNIANSLLLSDADLAKLKSLQASQTFSDAQITIYTYKPLKGVSTIIDPAGVTTYYDYDSFGRLREIYLIENNTKKSLQLYNYHYKNQ